MMVNNNVALTAGVVDPETVERYRLAGFGGNVGMGTSPALIIIDVQYRTVGTTRKPFAESVKEFTTSCGEAGWNAVPQIAQLLALFREKSWPVVFAYVAPKKSFDHGALSSKVPAIMDIAARGYEFLPEVSPEPGEILLPKRHPSAFFGTPLTSHLVGAGVDTLVVTGATTSGCVRSSVTDAFSLNFRVTVPRDAVYDRSDFVHEANLFDMGQKYADVVTTDEAIASLAALES